MRACLGILLLLLLGGVLADKKREEYDIGSRFKVSCNGKNIAIVLKPMRMFSLSLVSSHIPENVKVEVSSNTSKTCTMSKHHTICTYADLERELNISCTDDYEFVFEIAEPLRLAHRETHKEKYVEVDLKQQGDSGVFSVKLTKELAQRVKELLARKKPNYLPLFSYTTCVQNIALFEDHFKIAVEHVDNEPCVVGVRVDGDVLWHYEATELKLTSKTDFAQNYLNQGGVRIYELTENFANFTFGVIVESDVLEELSAMQMEFTFISNRGEEVSYNVTNFEKGVYPFRSIVHHPAVANKLRVRSAFDAFFYLSVHPSTKWIELTQDEYVYTQIKKEVSFMLTLDEFEDIVEKNISIKLVLADPASSDHIKFKYAQCEKANCESLGAPVDIQTEFQPKCKKIGDTGNTCVLLVTVTNTKYKEVQGEGNQATPGHSAPAQPAEILGLLPYIPLIYEEIEVNKHHTGVLHNGEEARFRIPKEKLEKLKNDEIILEVQGAEAYITYQPDCKRIFCADFVLRNRRDQLPKLHQNDMQIILKGSGEAHYSLMIDTADQSEFTLTDGYVLMSRMAEEQDEKYFTFVVDDRKKSIDINCNAPDDSVTVYVNFKNDTFPTESKYDLKSTTGQILVKAEDLKDGKTNLLILVKRNPTKKSANQTEQALEFAIVVAKSDSPIQPITNFEYYDTLRPSAQKTFYFDEINNEGNYGDTTIKIEPLTVFSSDNKPSIEVFVGNEKHAALNETNWDFKPIALNDKIMKEICKDLAKDAACIAKITIRNKGKEPLDFSYLAWRNSKPFELKEGDPLRIPTAAIGREVHLYYKITDLKKPINIYAYSNEVKTRMLHAAYAPEKPTEIDVWPFPLPVKSEPPKAQGSPDASAPIQPSSFGHHFYLSESELEAKFGKATEKYVLFTIVPILGEESTKKKGFVNEHNKGFLRVTASSGTVNLREEDKMQFTIEGTHEIIVRYDIKELINFVQLSKNQFYFHTTPLSGQAYVDYEVEADGIRASTPMRAQRSFVDLSVDYIKRVTQKYNNANTFTLVFKLKNADPRIPGSFLVDLVSSELRYHKLIMGIPNEFFIPKNTSIVFEYIDNYHQDFRLRVFRKEGLPIYKVKSCSSQQSAEECMLEIEKTKHLADPDSVLSDGRSHELLINSRSKEYCKDCLYYFAFFATTEDIYGSATVIGDQTATMLIAGRAMTTEVEEDETDIYMFAKGRNMQGSLTITPLKNTLKVWITDVDSNGKQIEGGEVKKTIIERDPVQIIVPKNDNITWHGVHIQSREKQGSTYTLLLQQEGTIVNLEDGNSVSLAKPMGAITNFEYTGKGQSTLIVMSDVMLAVSLTCPAEITLNETSMPGGTQTRVQSINPTKKEDKNSTSLISAERLNQIDFSMVSKIRTFALNSNKCQHYRLSIRNDASAARFTVLVNAKDIVMMQANTTLPGKLNRGATQNYEIPITEACKIKIVLRMCLNGQVRVGLTQQRGDIALDKFPNEFQTNGQQSHYANTFQAHAGMLYISVKSLARQVDYTLQVYIVDKSDQLPTIIAHLPKRNVQRRYIGEVAEDQSADKSMVEKAKSYLSTGPKLYEYELTFYGVNVEDESGQHYNVSYVIAESRSPRMLKKFKDCRGALMEHSDNPQDHISLTRVNHTIVGHSIQPSASDAEEKVNNYIARVIYRSKFPNSYVTVMSVVLPVLPGYVPVETYKTVHLNRGALSFGPLTLLSSFVGAVHDGVQQTTNLSNGLILNILVLLTIVVMGMGIYIVACCVSAGCIYGWRMQRYQMLRTHQPSEHELRHARHAENNSLDMLESARQPTSEELPTIVEVHTNRFQQPEQPAPPPV